MSSYSLNSTVCMSYKLTIQRFFRVTNLNVISRISLAYEAFGSLCLRCAHDSGVVGKVLCTVIWIAYRVLSTNLGTKRFVCDSSGLDINGVNLAFRVAMKTVNHFLNYQNREIN